MKGVDFNFNWCWRTAGLIPKYPANSTKGKLSEPQKRVTAVSFSSRSASDVKLLQVCVSGPASACPGSACFSAGKSSQHPTGLEREAEQHEAFFPGPCTWTWR